MSESGPKYNPDIATDTELAVTLIFHIENPCETAEGHNIRDFYIREAKKALEIMTNEYAKKALSDVIKKFTDKK